jgi:predicted Fe-S protein YdhL (DUF1289 family)
MNIKKKSSPCIGFCSTTYGDDICRGCYRTIDEVLNWRQKSSQEQQKYYDRLSHHVKNILQVYWTITDPIGLEKSMESQKELYWPVEQQSFCPYFSLFQLLQSGINPFISYSCYIQWNTTSMSLSDLTRIVSKSVYASGEYQL